MVIGITGSIAACKIPFLVRLLIEGAEVKVVAAFGNRFRYAAHPRHPFQERRHLPSFRQGDRRMEKPCGTGALGRPDAFRPRYLHPPENGLGIADNFLITAYLSARCPVMVAPAMDLDMYRHPSTQRTSPSSSLTAMRSSSRRPENLPAAFPTGTP
ncbi:MAG: hypothetical protein MZU84_01375 [Sphingobacterium sp.]|nr:hypothetical protein [Sphingobacterium sp.]